MDRRQINSLSDIDIPPLDFDDISYRYGTCVSCSSGIGREKKRSSRMGVQTEIGDIREDLWYQLAEQVIGMHGETWLLEALETWCKEMEHLTKRSAIQKLELSRRYWKQLDVGDWKIVVMDRGGDEDVF